MDNHTHPQRKIAVSKTKSLIEHLNEVKEKLDNNRDCSDILKELATAKSTLNNIYKLILEDHITHCIANSSEDEKDKLLSDLVLALDNFIGLNNKNFYGIH